MFCRTSVRSWGEVKDSKLSYLWSGIIDRGRMQGAWSKSDGDSKIARALGGTRYTFIVHETHCGCLAVGGVVLRLHMQKVRSPSGSADLRGTPAKPEFAQWRSAFTMCLASASSLS